MSEEIRKVAKGNFLLGLFAGMAFIAVIGFFALLVIVFTGNSANSKLAGDSPSELVPQDNQPIAVQAVVPPKDGESYKGGKDAKVTMIVYTDFECPYCLNQHETINQLIKIYGNKIKVVIRNFPLSFHANAQKASEAYECAAEQGKAFEMADAIFSANGAGTMSVDLWKTTAKKLGLKIAQFNDCLDNGEMTAKVAQDANEGSASGVDGTPATFINGQLISGAVPIENFQQMIDSLLQ